MSKFNGTDRDLMIDDILVTEVEIDLAVRRIADEIGRYAEEVGNKLLLLGILKGSVVFLGDLIKRITAPLDIDFMRVSSDAEGGLDIPLGLTKEDIIGKDIVIVEDIVDSCRTLSRLVRYLEQFGAKSVKTCTLLDKPSKRTVDFTPDFVGIEIPDEFVVGYGLDYKGQFRALPYIGVLKL